jgi:hypothetical protein
VKARLPNAWKKTFKTLQNPCIYYAMILGGFIITLGLDLQHTIEFHRDNVYQLLDDAESEMNGAIGEVDGFLRDIPPQVLNLTQTLIDVGSETITRSVKDGGAVMNNAYTDTANAFVEAINVLAVLLSLPAPLTPVSPVRIPAVALGVTLPSITVPGQLLPPVPVFFKVSLRTLVKEVSGLGLGVAWAMQGVGGFFVSWGALTPVLTLAWHVLPSQSESSLAVRIPIKLVAQLGKPGVSIPLTLGLLLLVAVGLLRQGLRQAPYSLRQPLAQAQDQLQALVGQANTELEGVVQGLSRGLEGVRTQVNAGVSQGLGTVVQALNRGLDLSRAGLQALLDPVFPVTFPNSQIPQVQGVLFPNPTPNLTLQGLLLDPRSLTLADSVLTLLAPVWQAGEGLAVLAVGLAGILAGVPLFILVITALHDPLHALFRHLWHCRKRQDRQDSEEAVDLALETFHPNPNPNSEPYPNPNPNPNPNPLAISEPVYKGRGGYDLP